jgi:hypothetical protein
LAAPANKTYTELETHVYEWIISLVAAFGYILTERHFESHAGITDNCSTTENKRKHSRTFPCFPIMRTGTASLTGVTESKLVQISESLNYRTATENEFMEDVKRS